MAVRKRFPTASITLGNCHHLKSPSRQYHLLCIGASTVASPKDGYSNRVGWSSHFLESDMLVLKSHAFNSPYLCTSLTIVENVTS